MSQLLAAFLGLLKSSSARWVLDLVDLTKVAREGLLYLVAFGVAAWLMRDWPPVLTTALVAVLAVQLVRRLVADNTREPINV